MREIPPLEAKRRPSAHRTGPAASHELPLAAAQKPPAPAPTARVSSPSPSPSPAPTRRADAEPIRPPGPPPRTASAAPARQREPEPAPEAQRPRQRAKREKWTRQRGATPITLRAPADLRDAIEAVADELGSSLGHAVAVLVREGLRARAGATPSASPSSSGVAVHTGQGAPPPGAIPITIYVSVGAPKG